MTIFSNNSIFQPTNKHIKFYNSKVNVVNGANVLVDFPLCDIKLDYNQYQRLSVTIPKETENFVLSFPMLGIKSTFLIIKPKYPNSKNPNNYMKWKFQYSSDAKLSFTNLLALTGTASTPIPNLLIDNPSKCDIQLEVLVSGVINDYLNDTSAFLYLNNLQFTDIKTLDETNSGILAFYNSQNELAGTLDIIDVINVSKITNQNRIVIDESSTNNVVLDFVDSYHTLQALSALNWLLMDPNNRALPKVADEDEPIVTFTPLVTGTDLLIELSNYNNNTFTKQDFIDNAIASIFDAIDGVMYATINDVTFYENNQVITNITTTGTDYQVHLNVSDIAGNVASYILDTEVTLVDTVPPVITTTNNVTGTTLTDVELSNYNVITPLDILILSILSVVDDVDGPIALSNVNTQLYDSLLNPINDISVIGSYTVEFNVSDSSGNIATLNLNFDVI